MILSNILRLSGRLRLVLIAFLGTIWIAFGSSSAIAQQPSAALLQKSPQATELTAVATQRGHVRVIVEFASPLPPSQIRPDPALLEPLKAQIAARQNAIIATHFGSASNPRPGQGFARRLTRMEISPMFSLNVNRAEMEALAADPRVLRIHYDQPVPHTLIQSVPLIGMTGASGAYALGATGSGQAVAVLDTGVQADHEFLAGKVIAEACFSDAGAGGDGNPTTVSLCPNGTPTQTGAGAANSATAQCINGSVQLCEHGTHVAGIAAGFNTSQGAGEPPNGVSRDGKIFAVQIFTRFNDPADCNGSAPCILSYSTDQIRALDYVLANINLVGGVKVASVNMSLGGGLFSGTCDDSASQKPSIDNLRAAGVATAIAAGNDGSVNQISSPGCISSAITVGSTTKADAVSSFSNMSAVVDLLAPGSSILSSIPVVPASTTTYAFFSGTSMATPHVAGAFAAIRTACPTKTVDEIETALKNTGLLITDTRPGGTQTKPRIRVDMAVAALNCTAISLAVSPASNMASSGTQGGPFSPSSFDYTLSASSGSVNYSISGVPSWLTASATSGTVTTSGTIVTFTVNASANSLAAGTYNATITFTNTTNGQGTQTRTATLTVSPPPVLQVSPATDIAASGNPGGPFSPSSFQYQLSSSSGSINYSISSIPSWLNASSTSGVVTTSPTTITFTVNASANSLSAGSYDAIISFTNTTNSQGNQTRNASLTVNPGGGGASAMRTWVSSAGIDSNDCSLATPCLTFAGAIVKTASGGEINCLDPGSYGRATIIRSVTIDCSGTFASILASGMNGINVSAAGIKVILRGLEIAGTGTGLNGVNITAGAEVRIDNCNIWGFTGSGIVASFSSAGLVNLFVADTYIAQVDKGISMTASGSSAVIAVVRNVYIYHPNSSGIESGSAGTYASVSSSMITGAGVAAIATLGGNGVINVASSMLTYNNTAILASSSGSVIRISDNNILNNNASITIGGGATVASGANNKVDPIGTAPNASIAGP